VTLGTLLAIKNPPVVSYARQANIAHGPRQVINASAAPDDTPCAGARENLDLRDV